MKNQLFAGIILCTFLTMQVSAQITNSYDLSDYKLPELKYQMLDVGINVSGNSNSSEVDNYSTDMSGYAGNVSASYNSYLNSAKFQRNSRFSIAIRGDRYSDEDSTGKRKTSRFLPDMRYSIENRTYLYNKFFVETDMVMDYRFSNEQYHKKNDSTVLNDRSYNRHTMIVSVPLKVGIGRIEPVNDYYQAIYIYEELLKSGRASSNKTDEDVLELAALISKLKRTRSFDSRIKNIQDVEAIDSFMIANNFKTISDARYFATLVDNWNFAPDNGRYSGTTIALAFTPAYYYSFTKDKNIENTINVTINAWSTVGGLEFRHEKPLNLFWQNSTYLYAYGGMENYKVDIANSLPSAYDERIFPSISLRFAESIRYYPNTRTTVGLSLGAEYARIFDRTDEVKKIYGVEGSSLTTFASLQTYYYVSPRLRLDFKSNFNYRALESPDMIVVSFYNNSYYYNPLSLFYDGNANELEKSSASFSLSLRYSIF